MNGSRTGSDLGEIMDVMMDSILAGDSRAETILLFAEAGADCGPPRRAVEALGRRVARQMTPDEAICWMGQGETASLLWFEMDAGSKGARKALEQASHFSAANKIPLVVSTPLASLEAAFRSAAGSYVSWLCDPDPEDRISALALSLEKESALHDMGTDLDTQRLRRLADEVSRIARALSRLSSSDEPSIERNTTMSDVQLSFRAEPAEFDDNLAPPDPSEIRKVIRLRRMRDRYFDASLFADPAWDMLLDLMAARLEHARVAVSSLCIAASVPPTTALRWIKAMSDHYLFERCADPDDGRRIFIQLSDRAMLGMTRYFDAAKKAGGLVI